MDQLFTSESVSEGHPDKIADQIADSILDAIIVQDPHCRAACETLVKTNMVIVTCEISTIAWVDIEKTVRHLVAAGLASRCEIRISYTIGIAEPVSLRLETFGTGKTKNAELIKLIKKHFDLRPYQILETLKLLQPIYSKTATYGHFGRS